MLPKGDRIIKKPDVTKLDIPLFGSKRTRASNIGLDKGHSVKSCQAVQSPPGRHD